MKITAKGVGLALLAVVGLVLVVGATGLWGANHFIGAHGRAALVRGAGPRVLTALLSAEERWRSEAGAYTSRVEDLAKFGVTTPWTIPGSKAGDAYRLTVTTSMDGQRFTGRAEGTITGGGVDVWTIDQDGNIEHVEDGA